MTSHVVSQAGSVSPNVYLAQSKTVAGAMPASSLPRLLGTANTARVTGQKTVIGGMPAAVRYGVSTIGVHAQHEELKAKYQFEGLEHLGQIGYGAFGSVTLVSCKITGQVLALKALSKNTIVNRKMEHRVVKEKRVMQQVCSPFVIRLAACFNRHDKLFFLMEAAMGGDLFTSLHRHSLFGSDNHSRFYFACVASALEHLHARRILYRDIKLENVVLDARGYAKLCDFGLATIVKPADSGEPSSARAYTRCGTPQYMAPEMMGRNGYSFAADWWGAGVLVFEMQTGETPFDATTPKDIVKKVKAGIDKVKLPPDSDWPELVRGLCQYVPEQRLAVKPGGLTNCRNLKWFLSVNFDWAAHMQLRLQAPYVPALQGPRDTSNFDAHDLRDRPTECTTYDDPRTGWDTDFEDTIGPVLRPQPMVRILKAL